MVALTSNTSIEAELSCLPSADNNNKKSNPTNKTMIDPTRRPPSPTLVMMLGDECHNSFMKRPNEEPTHIWNTSAVESHNHRMKKLNKKLAKANRDIAKLKKMLLEEDEKHELEMNRIEQREKDARQDILTTEEHALNIELEASSSEFQYEQLKARLDTNLLKIKELRTESKSLKKDLRRCEKQYNSFKFNNDKLSESSSSLFDSYSNLGMNEIFEENDWLQETRESTLDEFEALKHDVTAMQDRYMEQAQQRLEVQKTMAHILYWIQEVGGLPGVSSKLANACTQLGIDCESRATKLMQKLQQEQGE